MQGQMPVHLLADSLGAGCPFAVQGQAGSDCVPEPRARRLSQSHKAAGALVLWCPGFPAGNGGDTVVWGLWARRCFALCGRWLWAPRPRAQVSGRSQSCGVLGATVAPGLVAVLRRCGLRVSPSVTRKHTGVSMRAVPPRMGEGQRGILSPPPIASLLPPALADAGPTALGTGSEHPPATPPLAGLPPPLLPR